MTDAVQAAIEAARANAGNVSQEASQALATSPNTGSTAVSAAPQRGQALTAFDMLSGNMSVKDWLKVNEFGLSIGDDQTFFDEIKDVVLNLRDVQYNWSVKYGNSPVTYEKTYDHLVSQKGKPWADVLAFAAKMGSSGEYRSADVAFEVQNEIVSEKGPKKGQTLVEAGESLGHGFSTTSWASFAKLLQEVRNLDMDIDTASIMVDIGYRRREGKGNTWGITTFSNVRKA